MSQSNAAVASDGHHHVWINVTFTPSLEQLADHLWDGLSSAEIRTWTKGAKITAKRVREAVQTSLRLRGSQFFIESEDDYENNGGREWAQTVVRRVYKFPELAD